MSKNKLRFSTNDYYAIGEFIADLGGIEPNDEVIQEILDALDNLDALDDLVFLESSE